MRDRKLLIGLRHYTADKYKDISVWTIPGGRSDGRESLETTLRREVAEEVGVTSLTIQKFIGEVPGAKEGDVVHVFLASTDEEPRLMEPEKFSEWKWQSLSDMPENFINPAALKLIIDSAG